ncbi:pseudouridine-5'-phosphate glycosidase [soil metagenome]
MNLKLNAEVKEAIAGHLPVVALESTVIAHGLPYPQNLETAFKLESIVRQRGAVPATIAVLDGEFTVGLAGDQLERLATDRSIRKISRRGLAVAVAKKLNCATTVASTSFIANLAGIKVFSTGGIGGVHRGFAADISADLPELAQTPITVVCSGPKAILDLAATREWLETHGITVLGWRCDEMPAFYSRTSGMPVEERVDTAGEAAAIVRARDELNIPGSILVVVPIPEENEIPRNEIEAILADSLRSADAEGIVGNDVTPFLLSEMGRLSGGRTLSANIALLESNAFVAADIAAAISGGPE